MSNFFSARHLILVLAAASVAVATDVVQVLQQVPSANEQNLVPGQVHFQRSGSGSPLDVQYRISGSAISSLHGGQVSSVRVDAGGAGYLNSAAPVTFNYATGGTPTVAPVAVGLGTGGRVTSITLNTAGTNYTATAPAVAITSATGSGATAAAIMTGYVDTISVTAGGAGYTSAPAVVLTGGGGSGATATAIVSGGTVTNVIVNLPGSNYTSAPNIGFSGGGATTAATATAAIAYRVQSFTVTSSGQGYQAATVFVQAPAAGGTTATGTATLTGSPISSVRIDSNGYGFPMPTITASAPPSGTTAVLRPVLTDGTISAIVIESGGSGYASAPTITISAPAAGVQATATAAISGGAVTSVTITAAGAGYGPTATIPNPGTADIAVIISGADFTAPAGSAIDPTTGDLIGHIIFASNEVDKFLDIVPQRNGVGGGRDIVVSIDPSSTGAYIVNSQSSTDIIVADADVQASLSVPSPIAYPTLPSIPSAGYPLEVQGRGEWHIALNDSTLYRSVTVQVTGDPSIGPQAVQGTDYTLAYDDVPIAQTSSRFTTVVPPDPNAIPLPNPPGPGATTLSVASLGWFSQGREVVMFENPTDPLNGIYVVTSTTAATATAAATITITPALRRIQTSYGNTRVRRIGIQVPPPAAGATLTNSLYGYIGDVYYYAFPIIVGNAPQGRRSINLSLVQSDDYRTLSPTNGAVTVADDAVTVGLSLGSNAAKPSTSGTFNVVLSAAFPVAISVPFAILNSSTATFGSDYTINGVDASSLVGSVQVPAGSTTATITVQPTAIAGGSLETLTIRLLNSADYLLAPSGSSPVNPSATMSIAPLPLTTGGQPVYLSITAPGTVGEGAGSVTFTVRVTDAAGAAIADTLASPIAVGYTVGGSATPGSDFTAPSGSLAMAALSSSGTITIPILDDTAVEPDETLILSLNPGAGYQVSTNATASTTIIDNEPRVSIAAGTGPTEGGAQGIFTVTSSVVVNRAGGLVVQLTAGGTATSGTDYTALPPTVTIPQGQTAATITVSATADAVYDPNETITLDVAADTASPATYAVGTPSSASMTIIDPTPGVSVAAGVQPVEGGVPGTFIITASAPVASTTTVNYTINGTATSGTDFTALSGTTTITAGATTATVSVTALADAISDPGETIVLTLAPGAGYTPSAATATLTIAEQATQGGTRPAPSGSGSSGGCGAGALSLLLGAGVIALGLRRRRVR